MLNTIHRYKHPSYISLIRSFKRYQLTIYLTSLLFRHSLMKSAKVSLDWFSRGRSGGERLPLLNSSSMAALPWFSSVARSLRSVLVRFPVNHIQDHKIINEIVCTDLDDRFPCKIQMFECGCYTQWVIMLGVINGWGLTLGRSGIPNSNVPESSTD